MKRIWLFGLASIIITALFTALNISSRYTATLDTSRADTERLAQFLALDAERTFYGTLQMFDGIGHVLRQAPLTPPPFAPSIRAMLEELLHDNPFLMDLLILNERGDIIHWTGPGKPPMVRDREYAAVHLQSRESQFFVGNPQLSRVHKGQWFFGNSRALRDPDGTLRYILVAIADLDYFQKRYQGLTLPIGASLALVSEQGSVYTRLPHHQQFVGKTVEIPAQLLVDERTTITLKFISPLDGQFRRGSFRHIEGTPLIAAVSYQVNEVLAPWRTYAWIVGCFGFTAIAALGGMAWVIARYQRQEMELKELFQTQAKTDPLTGLANRRHALEICAYEVQRTCRYKVQLSLVLIDIDHFKSINDQYGHDAGDEVLKQFASLLNNQCRQTDLVSRIGGEEFLLVLSDTSENGARALAQKILTAINATPFQIGDGTIKVQASLGISTLQDGEEDISQAFKRADQALYQAKEQGRNRIV